jgi:hypothetical protein
MMIFDFLNVFSIKNLGVPEIFSIFAFWILRLLGRKNHKL